MTKRTRTNPKPAVPAKAEGVEKPAQAGNTAALGTPPPAPTRRRRFKTVKGIRLELADTIAAIKSGAMETGKARVLVYALSVLLNAVQGVEIERRLDALERSGGPNA